MTYAGVLSMLRLVCASLHTSCLVANEQPAHIYVCGCTKAHLLSFAVRFHLTRECSRASSNGSKCFQRYQLQYKMIYHAGPKAI